MARKLVSAAKSDWQNGAEAAAGRWEENFSKTSTTEEWADGISESSGGRVSAAQVKGSIGGERYQEAQRTKSASDYRDGVTKTVAGRSRADKWEEAWVDAWKKAR